MNGDHQASNVGPQKCDLKLNVLRQLAWFLSCCFYIVQVLTHYRMLLKRGTGNGGTPGGYSLSDGLYRAGRLRPTGVSFSGFKDMKG